LNKKIKKYIKEILIFVLFLGVLTNGLSYYNALDLNKDKLSISSFKLLDGTNYNIPKNKPILIHFWATWCLTCKLEALNIQKISKDYEVITIAVQSGTKKDIQNYLKKHKLSFKVLNDTNSFYAQKFNIQTFPTTLIYDKDKNLKFSEVGYTTTAGLYSRMVLSSD